MRALAQAVVIVLLLAILAGVAVLVVTVGSVLNMQSSISSRLTGVSGVVSSAQHALQNATDPNHPPAGLDYDTEFSALELFHIGDGLPGGTQYVLTVRAIHRRDDAPSPDTALYATIHAELRQPAETRLLGQLIRRDADPHDYVVYKGESFRIGRAIYRVNWISDADATVALATYRSPDTVTAPLKLDYD